MIKLQNAMRSKMVCFKMKLFDAIIYCFLQFYFITITFVKKKKKTLRCLNKTAEAARLKTIIIKVSIGEGT